MLFTSARPVLLRTALFVAMASGWIHGQAAWHVERTIPIGGVGGFDYITVDSQTHRLYVPRGTHTLVIDPESGKTLGDIPGQKSAHGVAVVSRLNRGFITDGAGNGSITVFDLKTYAVLGVIAAMPDADGIIYDAATGRILVAAGDSSSLITLDPAADSATGKVDAPIALGGKPEFLAADGSGKAYVNLEDKDVVAVVDLKARKVVARWPVAPAGAPVGLAVDAQRHVLMVGCRKPAKMIVMSTKNGKVLGDLPIGTGVDATKVNGSEAFASSSDGTLTVIREASHGKYEVEQTVQTARGARTMDVDLTTGKLYLPSSEYEEQAPGATGRPKPKPGTFKVLVVSK